VGEDRTPPVHRLTVDQAADRLGVSIDAVRARIRRGTIETEREGGRVYVVLNADQYNDRSGESSALISAKDELVSTLREQLQAEREAHAEARRIIAGLVERIPTQLEPPADAPGQGVAEAEDTENVEAAESPGGGEERETRPGRVEQWVSVTVATATVVGFLLSLSSAAGGFITSIVSTLNGDQVVALVAAGLGVVGSIGTTVLGIYLSRRWGNR
jgi:hypothetical protein